LHMFIVVRFKMPTRRCHQPQRCSSSGAKSSAVSAPEKRKLSRDTLLAAASQPSAERFMEAMWSDACTYGRRSVMTALDFYVVTELFVTDRGRPGGMDASAWEELAHQRKVAKVHRIPLNTAAEKHFSKGVGIGAFESPSGRRE